MNNCITLECYEFGSVEDVENAIRRNRVSSVWIDGVWEFKLFPRVTFITQLRILINDDEVLLKFGRFILSLPVLEFLDVGFLYGWSIGGENDLSNAIAVHPSLRSIVVGGAHGYGVETVMRRNPRITEYVFGQGVDLGLEGGDVIASLTGIKILWFENSDAVFRPGAFLRFVRNNPDISDLGATVPLSSETIEAIGHLRSVNKLDIECVTHDGDSDELRDAIKNAMMRCSPYQICVGTDNGCFSMSKVWPSYCFCRGNLPKWNPSGSRMACDITVYTLK